MKYIGRYLLNLLIALDQLVNTLIGGYPDETLSASAYLGEQDGKYLPSLMRPVIDFIFLPWGKEHCKSAFDAERKRIQLPDEMKRE